MYPQSEKNLLNSNISPTCPYNMANFGPLAAEIGSLVWGTPNNFNRFRVLGALLHGTLVVGVSQIAALIRGRHLYSAEQPSRGIGPHCSFMIGQTISANYAGYCGQPETPNARQQAIERFLQRELC